MKLCIETEQGKLSTNEKRTGKVGGKKLSKTRSGNRKFRKIKKSDEGKDCLRMVRAKESKDNLRKSSRQWCEGLKEIEVGVTGGKS